MLKRICCWFGWHDRATRGPYCGDYGVVWKCRHCHPDLRSFTKFWDAVAADGENL